MWRDDAYLLDMLINARRAHQFNVDGDLGAFLADEARQMATLYVLQIVGEAASKVSNVYRHEHPEIPWGAIIGLRHRLVHDYPRIDLRKVWDVVVTNLPDLIARLEQLVPPEGAD